MVEGVIRMYGTSWCGDCKRAKRFLAENRVPFEYVDIDMDEAGRRTVEETNGGMRSVPTIFFPDGSVLVEPSNVELAEKLGLQTRPEKGFYDVVTVGGGPAALTAAIYTARERLDTLVIERSALGGQAGLTERIENYPGFPQGISGGEFADLLVEQCRAQGVELLSAARVTSIGSDGNGRWVKLSTGDEIRCRALLLAPGGTYRRLGVPGEKDFTGAGVHYCATCDGPFYREKDVLVVGGGNSAVDEGLFLTRFAREVTIATRGAQLRASRAAQEKLFSCPRVKVVYETTVAEFRGSRSLASVTLCNTRTGERQEVCPDGVFVLIGQEPNTWWLKGVVELDERGFIVTDERFQTSVPGVFAAGDGRAGSLKQLVVAAGEGAGAAIGIRHYLEHNPRNDV